MAFGVAVILDKNYETLRKTDRSRPSPTPLFIHGHFSLFKQAFECQRSEKQFQPYRVADAPLAVKAPIFRLPGFGR